MTDWTWIIVAVLVAESIAVVLLSLYVSYIGRRVDKLDDRKRPTEEAAHPFEEFDDPKK